MKPKFRGFLSRCLVLTLLSGLLLTVAWAGSPPASFSFSFNYDGQIRIDEGQKTDAGETSGNHATVATTTWFFENASSSVTYWVELEGGIVVTENKPVYGSGTVEMPYRYSVTDGYLYLCGKGNTRGGAGGIAGTWYP